MLSHDDILKRTSDKPWVSPFEKIIGVSSPDENLIQVYEYHARNACYGAAAWAVYHYKQTSELVVAANRDGVRDIFTLKLGKCKLNLRPSYSSAGIEAVDVIDDEIHITYTGLAGGGVGTSLCRALANKVNGVIIHAEGGGDKLGSATLILPKMLKLQVGVDDTDKAGSGATWSLANEIAYHLGKQDGIEYLNHTLIQLYPKAPERTTNCVATVLTFGVRPAKLSYLKKELYRQFKALTLSDHTALAFWSGIELHDELVKFSSLARKEVVTLAKTISLAEKLGIELVDVTGNRGLIGAVAGLGFAEKQDSAVIPAKEE